MYRSIPSDSVLVESLERRRLLSAVAFQPQMNISDNATPVAVAVADMNGHGKQDLVVQDYQGTVSVLHGNGDGTFAIAQSIADGFTNSSGAIAIGDFNNDESPDVAVAGGGDVVSVLLNNGTGTLQAPIELTAAGAIHSLVVADVNGDGNADIITADGDGQISVFLGDGHGGFASPMNMTLNANGANHIVAGNFVTGGPVDLAVTNYQLQTVSILIGHNNGTFTLAGNYSGFNFPTSLATADFNSDTNADLAVSSLNGVELLLGNGNGTFHSPVTLGLASNVEFITAADLNGDEKPDLLLTIQNYQAGGQIAVALGNGDGNFQNPLIASLANYPQAVVVADIDGDGRPDLAVAVPDLNSVAEFLSETDGLPGIAINSAGAISASGTAGNDTISFAVSNGEITATINSLSRSFASSSVTSIRVTALAGNDTITIGAGVPAVFFNGGGGNDTIVAANQGRDTLQGGAGPDSIIGGRGSQILDGGNGADTLIAGKGNQTLTGDGGLDSLVGGKGADSLDGGTGNNTLVAGRGANTLQGNIGNDSLIGGAGASLLLGGPGADTLVAGTGNNTLRGNGGADLLDGSSGGSELLQGDGGSDTLTGDTNGGTGIDTLIGGAGINNINPGPQDSVSDGNG